MVVDAVAGICYCLGRKEQDGIHGYPKTRAWDVVQLRRVTRSTRTSAWYIQAGVLITCKTSRRASVVPEGMPMVYNLSMPNDADISLCFEKDRASNNYISQRGQQFYRVSGADVRSLIKRV